MSENLLPTQQITVWLAEWRKGSAGAGERLLDAVYPELLHIAARFLNNERRNHTLEKPNSWASKSAAGKVEPGRRTYGPRRAGRRTWYEAGDGSSLLPTTPSGGFYPEMGPLSSGFAVTQG